jgi:hypothetical protein
MSRLGTKCGQRDTSPTNPDGWRTTSQQVVRVPFVKVKNPASNKVVGTLHKTPHFASVSTHMFSMFRNLLALMSLLLHHRTWQSPVDPYGLPCATASLLCQLGRLSGPSWLTFMNMFASKHTVAGSEATSLNMMLAETCLTTGPLREHAQKSRGDLDLS